MLWDYGVMTPVSTGSCCMMQLLFQQEHISHLRWGVWRSIKSRAEESVMLQRCWTTNTHWTWNCSCEGVAQEFLKELQPVMTSSFFKDFSVFITASSLSQVLQYCLLHLSSSSQHSSISLAWETFITIPKQIL